MRLRTELRRYFPSIFYDSDRQQRNYPSPFEVLNRHQRVLIILQNLLFTTRSKIYDRVKSLSGTMCTNRRDMTNTKEGFMRNLSMLELADNKLSSAFDHDIAMTLVDSFHHQMGDTIFINKCEKISMAEKLSSARSARDRGEEVSFEHILENLTNVFKPDEQEEPTLHSALMACAATRAQMKPDALVRLPFGGESGSGKRHFDTTLVKSQDSRR
jgi:hypothetical protein